MSSRILAVNIGKAFAIEGKGGTSAIDKRPVDYPVAVAEPAPSRSGLAGDDICDVANHGGPDQAVYAYAREELDRWEAELGVPLSPGMFGENLTTAGIDTSGTEVGEQWRIGDVLLQAMAPRIPCRTFAVWLDQQGWVKKFTERALPGAYFRVLEPGSVKAGDEITVVRRPGHGVTMSLMFRAYTLEPDLLPRLLLADDLPAKARAKVESRLAHVTK